MTDAHRQADVGHRAADRSSGGGGGEEKRRKKSGKKLGFSIVRNIKGKYGKQRRET